jgi:hypothetical protein
MEQYVGKKIIDGVVVGPKVDVSGSASGGGAGAAGSQRY